MARYVPDPAQRVTIFLGEAGCGKSELAVQWALTAAECRRDVHFFDLDQTKPLLRSRDAAELLEGAGGDGALRAAVCRRAHAGGRTGAAAAGQEQERHSGRGRQRHGGKAHRRIRTPAEERGCMVRGKPVPAWSGTVAHIDGTLSAVLKAARLGLPRFLLNPTLGIGTTAEEFLAGVEQGLRLLTPYVKVEAAAVSETLLPEVEGRTELPLLPITPRMTVPETGLDEG